VGNRGPNSIEVVSRKGEGASQAAASAGFAAYPDLGPRHALAGFCEGGTPTIPCRRQEPVRRGGSGFHRRRLRMGRRVKRGEIWTVAGGKDYAGKPRPVVILQDDRFDRTESITVCAFTTDPTEAPLFRLPVEPNETNGLRAICRLMVDKITTVPKAKISSLVGRLADEDMVRLNRAVLVFLGIAAPSDKEQLEST
jgi:mRNA interferase MazF